ncbi:tail fiber domain-containing protein [Mesorhizobium sp.]|uniref:tail fiber domain-containing protein n=1 Tax=Mesorhizobium sp. TaxID=1871066 RepID=UPI000FE772B8|nr:tail fiber domain-containing protein [Mesorhizobium sp.]RWO22817.1 MAG: tail fiber domain-containing protein [Mesorhizobium sp.]
MSSKTSSTTENKPPAWAKGLFKQSAAEAGSLYNSGVGGNAYTGSTVADLSGTTMGGINQLATAGANTNTAGTRPLFQGIGAAATGPSFAEQNLSGIASGADNPYFERALEGQLGKTASQVQSQFAGAGRYGSGANTGALTSELGNIRSGALSNQWNQNIQNQLAATGQMDSARQAGLGLGLNATNAMAGQDQQQFQNALTGAGATLQAGGLLDSQSQKQLSDQVNSWYESDNADWNRLGLLQSAAAGAAGNYGTQTSRSSSSNPMGALGAVGSMFGGK